MPEAIEKLEFSPSRTIEPSDEAGTAYYAAGLTSTSPDCTFWIHRIQSHGKTQEDAEALSARVLRGLELVAQEERESEAMKKATALLVNEGRMALGAANVGAAGVWNGDKADG